MNVDSVLVSEYAAFDMGRLTILGAFNALEAAGFPVPMEQVSVSIVIHGASAEAGTRHDLEVHFLNQRRELVVGQPFTGEFTFPSGPPRPGVPLRHVHIVRLFQIVFPEPGPYGFEVYIDGTYCAGAAFYVELAGAAG